MDYCRQSLCVCTVRQNGICDWGWKIQCPEAAAIVVAQVIDNDGYISSLKTRNRLWNLLRSGLMRMLRAASVCVLEAVSVGVRCSFCQGVEGQQEQ